MFHCSSEGYQRAFCIQGFWQESKTIFQRPFSQLFGVVAASADLLSSQLVVKLKQRRSQQRFCLLYPTLLSEGALSRTSVFIQLRKCPLSFTMDSEVNQVENGVKNLGLHSTSGKTKFQIFFKGIEQIFFYVFGM